MCLSLARSVELTAQWDGILAAGPLYPVTLDDLSTVRGLGIGDFHRVGSDVLPMVHTYRWLRPDLVAPAPFLQCKPDLTPGGSGVLADPARIDEEFRKAWLPYFCRSGQRETSLGEFALEVDVGCLCFLWYLSLS